MLDKSKFGKLCLFLFDCCSIYFSLDLKDLEEGTQFKESIALLKFPIHSNHLIRYLIFIAKLLP